MPFVKNLKDEIVTALEPEVATLLKKGWKVLTAVEEAAYREVLRAKPEFTSAISQEEARVKAGVYAVEKAVKDVTGAKPKTAPVVKPAATTNQTVAKAAEVTPNA